MTDIADLYRTHRRYLLGVAWRIVRDRQTAEDVVQEVFATLLTKQIRDPAKALAFLSISTANRARDMMRSRARADDRLLPKPGIEPSAEHAVIERLQRTIVLDALRSLPPQQRAVYLLRYYADMSEVEISAALGIARGTIKAHTSKGKPALARRLSGVAA